MATQEENKNLIHALEKEVALLKLRVDSARDETAPIREITIRLAIIEHQLVEVTKTKELWGQRGWMILTICLSAVSSLVVGIFGVLLTFYLNSKK